MVKVKLVKKSVTDKKKGIIISQVETKERDNKKTENLEKALSNIVNSPTFNNNIKDGVIIGELKKGEKRNYKTKIFTTDKDNKVIKLEYKGKDFQSSHNVLKDVTVSFRGKPSIDDIKGLTNLIMDK